MRCKDGEYRNWLGVNEMKVPAIDFSKYKDLQVKPRPATVGALIRFNLIYKDKSISVYYDVDDSLGCVGEPYWEAYPFEYDGHEDVHRELGTETQSFFDAVYKELTK